MTLWIVTETCRTRRTSEVEADNIDDAWRAYTRKEHLNAMLDEERVDCEAYRIDPAPTTDSES